MADVCKVLQESGNDLLTPELFDQIRAYYSEYGSDTAKAFFLS